MSKKTSHTRKSRFRWISGLLMVAIYTVIALSPIAPVLLHSKAVAHALTGECVGDCKICGCSMEASESNTCCCSRKQQVLQNNQTSAIKSHCPLRTPPTQTSQTTTKKHSCCIGEKSEESINRQELNEQKTGHKQITILKCGNPCGKGKLFNLNGFGSNEHIPISSGERPELSHAEIHFTDLTHRLASRQSEPPDPPPKTVIFS